MAGRTDLRLFNDTGLTVHPATWGPTGARGVDKVAQRFLYFLLTPSGSVPGRPSDGTDFVASVRVFRSEFDLFSAFAAAEPAAAVGVTSAEEDDDDPSERYGWARLSGVALDGTTITLTLSLAAADGTTPTDPVTFTIEP